MSNRFLKLSSYVLALALTTTVACKHGGDDKHADFAVKTAKEDLPVIQAALNASATTSDNMSASSHCAAWFAGTDKSPNLTALEAAEPALAKQLQQACQHDVPLANLKADVVAAEAQHQSKPDGMLEVCGNTNMDMTKNLKKFHTEDAESKALFDRLAKVCQ